MRYIFFISYPGSADDDHVDVNGHVKQLNPGQLLSGYRHDEDFRKNLPSYLPSSEINLLVCTHDYPVHRIIKIPGMDRNKIHIRKKNS